MKAKKALKRLNRVDALISDVLDQYAAVQQSVRDLLDSAKASIVRASETMNLAAAAKRAKKPAAKVQKPKRHKVPKGPKKVSHATKKQVAAVKEKTAPPKAKKTATKKVAAKKPAAKKSTKAKAKPKPRVKATHSDPVESAAPTPEASTAEVHATRHSAHDPSSEE